MTETKTCERCDAPLVVGTAGGLCPACLLGGVLQQERDSAMFFDFDPDQPDATKALEKMLVGYTDLEPIGHGGMGVVYKARHEKLNRMVAIKVMRPRLADDPEFTDRFLRESRALAALDHPNVVKVYDFGEHAGLCFLVMELVDGASLRDMMRAGPLEPQHALAIVPQICDALQYAHGNGVVHRDIKPENILVDLAGRVRLADFGLAKLRDDVDPSLTRSGLALGTPHYMAPEQRSGSGIVDHRADIYSLGVTFYEMLTGHLPTGRFPNPSHEHGVDVRLDEVVLRAMEHDPDRRYQQASEIRSEVETIGSSPAIAAVAAAASPPPPPPLPRRRATSPPEGTIARAIVLVLAVAILGALVAVFMFWGVTRMEPEGQAQPTITRATVTMTPEQADRHLETAVRKNAPWSLDSPLRSGADPDLIYKMDGRLTSALIEGAKLRPEIVEKLLHAGATPDGRVARDSMVTPMCVAAARGKTESVKALLTYGADPALAGVADLAGEGVAETPVTALEWALASGRTETAAAILDFVAAGESTTTLKRMGIGGKRDFAMFELVLADTARRAFGERLLTVGADINAHKDGDDTRPTVLVAAILADVAKPGGWTKWALAHGADPDVGAAAQPPLLVAFRNDAVDAVQLLVDAGADVEIKVTGGATMIEFAATYGSLSPESKLCRDIMEKARKK